MGCDTPRGMAKRHRVPDRAPYSKRYLIYSCADNVGQMVHSSGLVVNNTLSFVVRNKQNSHSSNC